MYLNQPQYFTPGSLHKRNASVHTALFVTLHGNSVLPKL